MVVCVSYTLVYMCGETDKMLIIKLSDIVRCEVSIKKIVLQLVIWQRVQAYICLYRHIILGMLVFLCYIKSHGLGM